MSKKNHSVDLEVIDINELDASPEDARGKRLNLFWFLMYLVCIISICMVIVTFCFQRSSVDGESMESTLQDGDSVIVNKLSYVFSKPERYDIIVFKYDNLKDINYVKRIIGLPGETVQIKDGAVYVNGSKLEDDVYSSEAISNPGNAELGITLGKDEYFVLGDNRNVSSDSRYSEVGVVHKNQIMGKASLRIFPLGKFGTVK